MGRHHVAVRSPHLYTSYPNHSPASFHNNLKSSYASSSATFRDSSVPNLGLVVGDRIPGFRISAAFLSSLQSNLFIELDSAYDSSDESSTVALSQSCPKGRPSPLAHSMSGLAESDFAPPDALRVAETQTQPETTQPEEDPTVAEDGMPILKSFLAEDDDMRAEALHVIADSVAQQRNMAARAMIFHPLTLSIIVAFFAAVYRQFWTGDVWDWLKIGTTMMGGIMATLGTVRLVCGPYIFEAERIGTWSWLDKGRTVEAEEETDVRVLGERDYILLTKFGTEYIGAIIFRGVQPKSSTASAGTGNKRSRRAQSPSKHTKMVIRAWSVAQKYRRKEVGSALLEDALKIGVSKGWTVDGVEFAQDHANAKRVLPAMFNGPMDKYEKIARDCLSKKLEVLKTAPEKGKKKK